MPTPSSQDTAIARLHGAALRVRRPGQPHLRAAAVGGHAGALAAGRQAARRRRRHLRQRRRPHPRAAHAARLRDLQGGRATALARGARPARRGDRPRGRRHPALRQRRGRPPRHPATATSANAASPRWSTSCRTGAFVLGVDEHTASVLDLDAAPRSRARPRRRDGAPGRRVDCVAGRLVGQPSRSCARGASGARPVHRRPGRRRHAEAAGQRCAATGPDAADGEAAASRRPSTRRSPARDVPAAVNAILELDRTLEAWSADTTQSDEPDRVRATLRSMIVRLGELAVGGAAIRPRLIAPVRGRRGGSPRRGQGRRRTGPWPTSSATAWPPPASRSATPPTARRGT